MQPNDIRRAHLTPEQIVRYRGAMGEAQLRANNIVAGCTSTYTISVDRLRPAFRHYLRPTLSDTYCGLTQAEVIAKGELAVPTAVPWFDPTRNNVFCKTCWDTDLIDHTVDDAINALVSWINLETTWPAFKLLVMRIERDYPGTCRKCGGPAYIGLDNVDCKNLCDGGKQ